MPEPIAIGDAFTAMSEELADGYTGDTEHVETHIAERYGVPFKDLIQAVLAEQPHCAKILFESGPGNAMVTAQVAAFLAGVRWEQGRHTSSDRETAALALLRKIYLREGVNNPDAVAEVDLIYREIEGFIRQFGPLPEGIA